MKNILLLLLTIFSFVTAAHAQQAPAAAANPTYDFVYYVSFGRADDVKLMLSQGANANATNEKGWPLIAVAAARRDKEALGIVQALVEAGADVNKADADRNYPLFSAIKNNNVEMAQYLLSHNADIHVTNTGNLPPLQVAQQSNNAQIVALIEEALRQEAERIRQLQSPENKAKLIRDYAFLHCAIQYRNFYVASKQDPQPEVTAKVTEQLNQDRHQLVQVMTDLAKYFKIRDADINTRIAGDVSQRINRELNDMISNRNRRHLGVGADEDLQKRCGKLADRWMKSYLPKSQQQPNGE